MSNEQPVEYLLSEWARGFEQWLRDLTDGEAAFYVFFLEYGLEFLSAIVVAIAIWFFRKPRNKNNQATETTHSQITNGQTEQGVGVLLKQNKSTSPKTSQLQLKRHKKN